MRARLGALLLLLPASIAGQERSLRIERFHAEAVVLPGGTTVITERITARFDGQWNGIYRSIPTNYITPQKTNYKLILDVQSVSDGEGRPLRYEVENERGHRRIKMWVPNAVDATRTVILKYHVPNMLRFFDAHDELYWNVTGNDWDVPIEQATADVVLPTSASGIRATAYTGAFGARGSDASFQVDGNTIHFAASTGLGFREGLTAVVGWNPGVTARPSAVDKAGLALRSNLIFLIPLLVLWAMWHHWNKHGRDPRRLPITTAYEPPDLTPAEAGTLIDGTPDLRDITASIVDLAVRGYLVIEERTDKELFGLMSSTGYTFRLKRPRRDWEQLLTHERKLLEGIFQKGDVVEDNDLENKFYQKIDGIKNAIYDRLVERGHYKRRPDHVLAIYVFLAIIGGVVVGFGGVLINTRLGIDAPAAPIIAGVLTGGIMLVFALVMPARTETGARTLEKVLGFEEFLRRVESDRFERLIKTPELFEKYLPYAMALKLDRNWCRAFEDIMKTPPDWYTGSRAGHFSMARFNTSLSHMTAATGSAMTTAPRSTSSSGSSGFSSSGSSGGGFGGGGGGGF